MNITNARESVHLISYLFSYAGVRTQEDVRIKHPRNWWVLGRKQAPPTAAGAAELYRLVFVPCCEHSVE